MSKARIFCEFKNSPEIVRLELITYVRYPRSLRNAEGLPQKRGIDFTHETARFWGPFRHHLRVRDPALSGPGDAAGKITGVSAPNPGESWTYAYDELDRLTTATNTWTTAPFNTHWRA